MNPDGQYAALDPDGKYDYQLNVYRDPDGECVDRNPLSYDES